MVLAGLRMRQKEGAIRRDGVSGLLGEGTDGTPITDPGPGTTAGPLPLPPLPGQPRLYVVSDCGPDRDCSVVVIRCVDACGVDRSLRGVDGSLCGGCGGVDGLLCGDCGVN